MRRAVRPVLATLAVLVVGVICMKPYTHIIAPLCSAVIHGLAMVEQWNTQVTVETGVHGRGTALQLVGVVRPSVSSAAGSAVVVAKVTAGAGMQIAVAFWSVLLAVRAATWRQRFASTLIGIPVCLGLTVIAASCQLLAPCYNALATLNGQSGASTGWDYASSFLEDGGRIILSLCAAWLLMDRISRTARPLQN